jgi:YggT family protein
VIIFAYIVSRALELYTLLIVVWTFGSWFPQWRYQSWFRLVDSIVAPYVGLFRTLPLQFSGLDFTPLAAIIVIALFKAALLQVIVGGPGL